jgi:ClpP class serine protease
VDDLKVLLEMLEMITWEVREEFDQEVEETFRELCKVLSEELRETYIP